MTIKQRTEMDCGICCVAMALGLPYERVIAAADEKFQETMAQHGIEDGMLHELLARLGLQLDRDYCGRYLSMHYGSIAFTRNMLWGRRAIVEVKSKNIRYGEDSGLHFVYWDGAALHDPSNKTTYEWAEVEPIKMWLFSETARPLPPVVINIASEVSSREQVATILAALNEASAAGRLVLL